MKRLLTLLFLCLSLPLKAQTSFNETELAVWANEAIVATYTFNYQNFLQRQKEIARYFTANGWIAYSKALNDSKLPEIIQKNNYFISAVATAPPKIKNLRANNWEAIMPLLVVYKNPQHEQKQTLNVTIHFTTVPTSQGVRGKAITSLKSIESTPLCKCDIEHKPQI